MICPRCQGAAEVAGIACGPGGSMVGVLPCSMCEGAGVITEEHAQWIETGERLKAWRQSLDLSLREAARSFDTPAVDWSNAEHGKTDPRPLIAKVSAVSAVIARKARKAGLL